jgi:hypothetical protein
MKYCFSSKEIKVQQCSNASGCKSQPENVGSGAKGWGNSILDRPFCKVNAGISRLKDIVETYGKTEDKNILVQELLSLLKWNKRLGSILDYFKYASFRISQ